MGIQKTYKDRPSAGIARLPVFARLCHRAANILRLPDNRVLTSQKQTSWHNSAILTLNEMEKAGATLPGFVFIAHDERVWVQKIERVTAYFVGDLHEKKVLKDWPRGTSCASGTSHFDLNKNIKIQVGQAIENEEGSYFIKDLTKLAGSREIAQAIIIGHEWAHCWQHEKRYVPSVLACNMVANNFEVDKEIRDCYKTLAESLASRSLIAADQNTLEGLMSIRLEEAFSDAVGCWAASLMTDRDVVGAMIQLRNKELFKNKIKEPYDIYNTASFLRKGFEDGIPKSFMEFERVVLPKIAAEGARQMEFAFLKRDYTKKKKLSF